MKFLQKLAAEVIGEQPEIWEEPAFCDYGKRAIFYSGLDGKRNFAWIGLPEGASPDAKVPGVVLVHGGLGTAFARWVDYWNELGFAAIAMDTCGAMFDMRNQSNNWPRHSFSGPAGWGAFEDQSPLPPREQWFPHAITAIIKATSVLRGLPEVDSERIGLVGISWGAVLTCITAGLDPRYKAVCPVYGCGFLAEGSNFAERINKLPPEQAAWWRNEWDPSNFLPQVNAPVLWFNGTNDGSFHTDAWQKSTTLPGTQQDICLKIRWPHGHGTIGEGPREIAAFFREHLAGGKPRLHVTTPEVREGRISASVSGGKFASAMLCFTVDQGKWPDREWVVIPAGVDGNTLSAILPENCQAAFFQVLSEDWLTSSSPVVTECR